MAKLAIKGHPTRCKEVIEILEMLGGINTYACKAVRETCFYFIVEGEIYYDEERYITDEYTIFTLEEFFEKFPYKVGDKVQHKRATSCGSFFEVEKMRWVDNQVKYTILWYNNCRTTVTAEVLQPYKEEPMYLNRKVNEQAEEIKKILEPVKEIMEEIKLDIPDGYEFFGIDDDNKIVLTKKQSQYPKTYEECCDIIEYPHNVVGGYKAELLSSFQNLLICRDVYWKIAGEQMGLGKPWEPTIQDTIWGITRSKDEIEKYSYRYGKTKLLEFPTEEMRDEFYENFKDLIEACKEFL